jgi:DNA invertase Pin-like site-specific DNA recombinase
MKKRTVNNEKGVGIMIKKKVVIYLRLSKEDGDSESLSISNQRKILHEYARQHNLEITDEYVDDGVTGYTMNRPALNRLKQDLNNNIVNTILVKDLSRLGRHDAKVQLFIENIIEDSKQVISLGENFDSTDPNCLDTLGIHTWSNEKLVRDTSRKVRKSIESLQKEGKWLCNIPYGYIKDCDDKYKYHVDPIIAPYIKQIFEFYIAGMGIKFIARKLTEMNIPTPSMTKKMYAESNGKVYKNKVSTLWDSMTVLRILTNDFYIGTLTLGKSKRRSINGKAIPQSKDDMYIFPNTHEAIIDKATFELVQETIKRRSETAFRGNRGNKPNIFSGMLVCADCGKLMTSTTSTKGYTRFICKTYNIHGVARCSSHAITETELKFSMLEFLKHCGNSLEKIIDDLDNIIQAEIQTKGEKENNILKLTEQLQAAKKSAEILIEQKMRETIKNPHMIEMIDKMYDESLNEKYKEIQVLEKQLNDQHNFAKQEVEMKKNLNSALSIMNEILLSEDLTKKQVLLLVDKIVVHEDSGVDVYLKGDLHKITTNYFTVGHKKETLMKKELYNFIIENPEKFTINNAAIYIRENGMSTTYQKVAQIFKELLSDGLIELRRMRHGYRLIVSQEELKAKLIPNTIAYIRGCLCNNNDIFEVLSNISNWAYSLQDDKKKLF